MMKLLSRCTTKSTVQSKLTIQVFRIVSTDVWIPATHSMIIPAYIPGWKRSPIELAAVFEPHEQFEAEN